MANQSSPKKPQVTSGLLEFLKFGLVGASGILVDMAVVVLLEELFGMHVKFSIFPAFLLAVTWNYELNRRYTFDSKDVPWLQGYIKFVFVGISGLIIRYIVVRLLTDVFGFHNNKYLSVGSTKIPYIRLTYVANFIGIGVGYIINFLGSKFIAFQKEPGVDEEKNEPT